MKTLNLNIDGQVIKAEFDGPSGQQQAGALESITADLEKAKEMLNRMAYSFSKGLETLNDKCGPSEAEITFGLKLDGEANWIIGKTGTEASFEVTLKWTLK
jgi:hypothetical protein